MKCVFIKMRFRSISLCFLLQVWGASNTGHRLSFLPRLVLFFLKQFEYVVKIYLIVAVELGSYIGLNKNIGNYFTTDTPLSEVIAFCTI